MLKELLNTLLKMDIKDAIECINADTHEEMLSVASKSQMIVIDAIAMQSMRLNKAVA